jgi:type IV secretory pathway TrbD component
MDRLSVFLTLMTGSVLVGGLVIAVLSLGYYDWRPLAAAVAVGLVLTWPVAYAISRWIKREDPDWRPRSGAREDNREPRTDFPET